MQIKSLLTATALAVIASQAHAVDTVYYNAEVYTVDSNLPWASAFAVEDGKFVAVGSDSEIKDLANKDTDLIDLKSQFVMPGMIDSHTHPVRVIMMEDILFRNDNFTPRTPQEFAEVLRAYAEKNPNKEWIYGAAFSWSYFLNSDVKMDRHFIDKIVSDRPVVLEDDGGHVVVTNTKALEVAGVTKDTPDPVGGSIERDENGIPTGRLNAAPAIKLVLKHHPRFEFDDVYYAAKKATDIITSFGFTGIKVLEGDEVQMKAFQKLDLEGKLKMDVRHYPYQEDFYFGYRNDDAILKRDQYETEHYKVDGVKLFIDSTPFGRAIAVKEPFTGDGTDFGKAFTTYEQYRDDMVRWNGLGLSVATHTMGDRGLEMEIRAMEESAKVNGLEEVRSLRNQVAHAMMVDPKDLPRLRHVNGFLEFSPNVFLGIQLLDAVKPEMKMSVIRRFWPIADAVNYGVNYTIASDWIQAPMNPFLHIEQAMTRSPAGSSEIQDEFAYSQTISLPQAIKGYTINAARLLHIEDKVGSIEADKNANFVVIDQNPFNVPVPEIHKRFAKEVYFEGELVHTNEKQVERD
ncbi:amidohydrolase [Vibrio sp. SCSIO 43136]|uniref:amidohydrolase n=1 Tax=Vibrio sp. SCSIO 43136 TaxID=2819101 RepID=UPI002074BAF0|nr:amidohydrolase [Vibrio sp. SCSIO 43136]USD67193.1 amidohydrolase [Vibrio sp. SCSIO 43136]